MAYKTHIIKANKRDIEKHRNIPMRMFIIKTNNTTISFSSVV